MLLYIGKIAKSIDFLIIQARKRSSSIKFSLMEMMYMMWVLKQARAGSISLSTGRIMYSTNFQQMAYTTHNVMMCLSSMAMFISLDMKTPVKVMLENIGKMAKQLSWVTKETLITNRVRTC